MHTPTEVILAPPGAGVPWLERTIGKLWLLSRRTKSCAALSADVQRQRDAILADVQGRDVSLAGTPVLIKRLAGLEDSSRNWSIWMTIDHLRITNEIFGRIMQSLAKGVVPAQKASTAAVKPDPAADRTVLAGFQQACDTLLATASSLPTLETNARYAHPWFGDLDAKGWYALCGMHMGLHRKQMALITQGLAAQPAHASA